MTDAPLDALEHTFKYAAMSRPWPFDAEKLVGLIQAWREVTCVKTEDKP